MIARALVLGVMLGGCSRERPHARFVARVDGSTLTPDQLTALGDTGTNGRLLARGYINEWVTSELLYQEAIRSGIPESDEIRKQLDAARKQLSVSRYLEQELDLRDTASIPERELRAYFDSSAAAFALREDVANLSYALFSERDAANSFRSRVLRGTPWSEALRQARGDSLTEPKLLRAVDDRYFTHTSLYPEELWKLARSLGKDAVSFVVKTDEGYYVLQNHGMKRQGAVPDFDYVRGEVRHRVAMAKWRVRYEQLLRTLRAKHTVEITVDSADLPAAEPSSLTGG